MLEKNDNKPVVITVSRRAVSILLKVLLFAFALWIIKIILPHSTQILVPLVVSFLLASLLEPVVKSLERKGLDRPYAISLILTLFTLSAVLLGMLLWPVVSRQVKSIAVNLHGKTTDEIAVKLETMAEEKLPFLKSTGISSHVIEKKKKIEEELMKAPINLFPVIISAVISAVMIPIMTFFLLKDASKIKRGFIEMIPNRYFEMTLLILHKLALQLGSYIRGQLMVSFVIGTLSVIALYFLDVPYYFPIGVAAGVANVIPYFGPIVGAVPAMILNFMAKGTGGAIIEVIAAFAIIRLIDDALITPNILGKSVELHPILVLAAIFIGGHMFGLVGLVVCIPVTAAVKLIIKEVSWGIKNYRLG